MQGKIIRGIAGFYYIHAEDNVVYECRAKGIFRKQKLKPLVGDNVEIEILDKDKAIGNLGRISERKNSLIRPAVANIDQAIVFFAALEPLPSFNLLDRYLIIMEARNVSVHICFNKMDLINDKQKKAIADIYKNTNYNIIFTSIKEDEGVDTIKEILQGKTSVLAGPSGVGKSSLTNKIFPKAKMETGVLSKKISRGKHTTRHAEIFNISEDTYIVDTPGFTSISLEDMEADEIKNHFPEFVEFAGDCKFQSCVHVAEPICGVKKAVEEEKISKSRYDNYLLLYKEQKERRRY
jgi:ribosome small subunit-dependent GTPase A